MNLNARLSRAIRRPVIFNRVITPYSRNVPRLSILAAPARWLFPVSPPPSVAVKQLKWKPRLGLIHRRTVFTESITSIPTIVVPPLAFLGFFLSLWVYKCVMLVVFQNKIIYMPSIPPFSRQEKIDDYRAQCGNVEWEEQHIKSSDGTKIALAVGRLKEPDSKLEHRNVMRAREITLLYFQGNGSSLPPRLPSLSRVIQGLQASTYDADITLRFSFIALSYRGYWTSRGRPSQAGIEQDALAALSYAQTYAAENSSIILWGQSLGAGVATGCLSTYLRNRSASTEEEGTPKIAGLILETPFLSIRSMLTALYPQKWLPYRYLHPFLRSWWDSEAAIRSIASSASGRSIPVMLVVAGRDEVVPAEQAEQLQDICEEVGLNVRRRDVRGALHTEAMVRKDGRRAIVEFVTDIARNEMKVDKGG